MGLKLQDLRKYAIDNRTEITVWEAGRRCVINVLGQVRIPDDDREFRIDDVVAAADRFEMTIGGKMKRFSRDEIASEIADAFKRRGFAAASKEED
jgi:hypothetical protein